MKKKKKKKDPPPPKNMPTKNKQKKKKKKTHNPRSNLACCAYIPASVPLVVVEGVPGEPTVGVVGVKAIMGNFINSGPRVQSYPAGLSKSRDRHANTPAAWAKRLDLIGSWSRSNPHRHQDSWCSAG